MPKNNAPHRLVVVCDGARAILLADSGIAPAPRLTVLEHFCEPHAPTAAQGTDRPGRVHESHGVSRSAVAQTDFHAQAEAAFLARLAQRLNERVAAGEAHRILIVAPPRALGTLREHLSAQARGAIVGEMAKDLVKMPVEEIQRHIAS